MTSVLTSTSMQSRSMHILMKFSKSVLTIWLCSIHSCLWLLTWSPFLPCVLLVIHAPYELALAMFSFLNVFSYCWLPCDAMYCFLVSGLSLESCYHKSIYAMLCFSSKSEIVNKTCYVYMGAIISYVPFWLMFSRGLLFYEFSRIMPCLYVPGYVPVACCLLP